VERIGVRRGKQLPSGSAKSYFRWVGGVNQEITSASMALRHLSSAVFAPLRQDFAWMFVSARRASLRSAVVHVFCVSFNYLIRPRKQVRRNGDANLLGSLEIDRQIEFGRLHQS